MLLCCQFSEEKSFIYHTVCVFPHVFFVWSLYMSKDDKWFLEVRGRLICPLCERFPYLKCEHAMKSERPETKGTCTHTHTHTHTHVGFYGLRGLSIGVMVFILYKLYVLLPYTYPTPKLSPHRRRCIFPQKNSLCMIYKRFKLWGHWKCPHKSPSPCNTYVIPMSLYKFVSS